VGTFHGSNIQIDLDGIIQRSFPNATYIEL